MNKGEKGKLTLLRVFVIAGPPKSASEEFKSNDGINNDHKDDQEEYLHQWKHGSHY